MYNIKFQSINHKLLIDSSTIGFYLGFNREKLNDLIESQMATLVEFGEIGKLEGTYLINYNHTQIIIPQIAEGLDLITVKLKVAIAHNQAKAKRGLKLGIAVATSVLLAYNLVKVAPKIYNNLVKPTNEFQEELADIKTSKI